VSGDVLTPDGLEAALRDIGARRYHIHHPFHKRLHAGELARGQVQAWALNRYYYQSQIPIKDAVMISRLLEAHEMILKQAREFAKKAADAGDDGTGETLGGDSRCREEIGKENTILVRGFFDVRGQSPMGRQVTVVIDAPDNVGVADINDEEHGTYCTFRRVIWLDSHVDDVGHAQADDL